METGKRALPEFTSAMTGRELIFAAVGFVLHIFLLPRVFSGLIEAGTLASGTANFLMYAVMAVYTLVYAWGFLRRDFDALADRPFAVIAGIAGGYFIMMGCNTLTALLLTLFERTENPNNAAVAELVFDSGGAVSAMVIFLAPIVEEVLFRGAMFGFLRRYSRAAAYAVTVAVFALYHLWGFILQDAANLVYLVQYIPAGIILCRLYERGNTIWEPIGMHMLVNFVSIRAMEMLS